MMNAVEQTHAGGGRGGFASGSGHGWGGGVRTGVASAGPSLCSTSCKVRVDFQPEFPRRPGSAKIRWKMLTKQYC